MSDVYEWLSERIIRDRALERELFADGLLLWETDAPIRDAIMERQAMIEVRSLNRPFHDFHVIAPGSRSAAEVFILDVGLELDPTPAANLAISAQGLTIDLAMKPEEGRVLLAPILTHASPRAVSGSRAGPVACGSMRSA